MNLTRRNAAACVPYRIRLTGAGFTLIELLAAVGIIGLLLALVLPALNRAQRTTRQTVCLSNQREFGQVLMIYVQNNNGFLPRRGQGANPLSLINRPEDWFNALPPLLGQPTYNALASTGAIPRPGSGGIWMCPEASENNYPYFLAYGMNMCLSTWNTALPDHINKTDNASTMVFLADGTGQYCALFPSAQAYSPTPRHDGQVVISFVDGHASTYTGAYIGCGVGDPQRPDVRWVVPDDVWKGPPQ